MTVPTQRADPPFAGHPGPGFAVAITPDGTQIITAGDDGTRPDLGPPAATRYPPPPWRIRRRGAVEVLRNVLVHGL